MSTPIRSFKPLSLKRQPQAVMGHFAHGFKWKNGRIQTCRSTPFQWFLGDLPSGIYLLKLSEIAPQGGRTVPPVRVIKTQ